MITPAYLNKGDKIGIVAPAKWIAQDKYPNIVKEIESKGYAVERGKTCYLEEGPFAGSKEERIDDLQRMLDSPEIKAIFCLRGGYGTIQIIEHLEFSKFVENPKWLVGFSDISILHNALSNLTIESVHGQMPVNFNTENKGVDALFETLEGKPLGYDIKANNLNKTGEAQGMLTGGNLAILCSLIGTPYEVKTTGKILFIEEVGEYLYRLDRMMYQLKLAGLLKNISGLIIGGLSAMEDNSPKFGMTAEEIILNAVKDYSYPVCFDFPAGHIPINQPLILGRRLSLSVLETGAKVFFKE